MAAEPDSPPKTRDVHDARLYVPFPEGWEARVKHGWEKEYCYVQNPGEDFFHLLINGEVYVLHGTEKYCLSCALRRGFVTANRFNWQRGAGAGTRIEEPAEGEEMRVEGSDSTQEDKR